MTLTEFNNTNWKRGNKVRLDNGKEYLVKGVKGHGWYILLYSLEFNAHFVADHRIVEYRTSDYEEPEEVYFEKKRMRQEATRARLEAERLERLRIKAERRERNLHTQERIRLEAMSRKAAKKNASQSPESMTSKAETPHKRTRIRIKVASAKVENTSF